ncbi:hypothetical protein CDAR_434441 [Caerostris darwini]|uniref:Uncharacterized protein n=1 Tax=Caerostris darwini TaxID=1538125 RepID=A0AAV4PH80_9ARAC|nr:hypothetical protein CDAR_434441 [Caerostris darwini]
MDYNHLLNRTKRELAHPSVSNLRRLMQSLPNFPIPRLTAWWSLYPCCLKSLFFVTSSNFMHHFHDRLWPAVRIKYLPNKKKNAIQRQRRRKGKNRAKAPG